MPYAHDGRVSTSLIEGGVEITQEQYRAAIDGMIAGQVVTIDGGFAVIDPMPPPEPEPKPEPAPLTTADVDTERDRRIDGGMTLNGVTYQTRPQDRENVAGASILALAAISNGAQPGDLRWHGEDTDFVWIAEDNSTNTMDAQTFFAFAQAMAKHKSAHIFAARAIKDIAPIPADYAANEAYWP